MGRTGTSGMVGEPLTTRAILLGLCSGTVVAAINVAFGLRAGWTQGGSILAVVSSVGLSRLLERCWPPSSHTSTSTSTTSTPLRAGEANMAQTLASSAGALASATGLVGPIPALEMLGHSIEPLTLLAWGATASLLGIFFSVPLRRMLVVEANLLFPSGTATYHTINSVTGSHEGADKAQDLVLWALVSGLFTFLSYFAPVIERPPVLKLFGLAWLRQFGWNVAVDPMLIAGGMLAGERVGLSALAGCVVSWAALARLCSSQGWCEGDVMDFQEGVRGWILWPGVALMVGEAVCSVALAVPWAVLTSTLKAVLMTTRIPSVFTLPVRGLFFLAGSKVHKEDLDLSEVGDDGGSATRSFESYSAGKGASETEDHPDQVTAWLWMGGLGVAWCGTGFMLITVFDIHLLQVAFVLPLSALLACVAVHCAGVTDINPIGPMGKVTQLVFAVLSPGEIITNLMAAAVVAAAASQAGDLCQDFKTGALLGASPRKQVIAQLIGVPFGVLIVVPIYKLFTSAYEFGSPEMPAPAAQAWKAVAEVLAQGVQSLPPYALHAMVVAFVFGVTLTVTSHVLNLNERYHWRRYMPSCTSMGISFIIIPEQSLALFTGSCILLVWRRLRPKSCEQSSFNVASGILAGAGLLSVLNAIMTIAQVPKMYY